MNSAPPPIYPPAPPLPPKKPGIPAIGWVGIGCGTFLIIGIIASVIIFSVVKKSIDSFTRNPEKSLAELFVRASPELEKISEDDAKGEMTIRTKKGEQFTVSYKELAEGKFSFTDSKGNKTQLGGSSDLTEVPAWVPRVPSITGDIVSVHNLEGGKASGLYTATSTATKEEIVTLFTDAADTLGATTRSNTNKSVDRHSETTHSFSGSGKSFSVTIIENAGQQMSATVTYQEN
jgi:hypothetical protein